MNKEKYVTQSQEMHVCYGAKQVLTGSGSYKALATARIRKETLFIGVIRLRLLTISSVPSAFVTALDLEHSLALEKIPYLWDL